MSAGVPSGDGRTAPDPNRRAESLDRVRSLLLALGTTGSEIDRAVADDVIDLLVVDRMLIPAGRLMTQNEVCKQIGIPLEQSQRIWRALGFLDVDGDEPAFTDMDLEALGLFHAMLSMGAMDLDSSLQIVRVIGSSMARIAEAITARGSAIILEPSGDSVVDADAYSEALEVSLPAVSRLLEFVWRRHVQAATRRTMLMRSRGVIDGTSPVMAVGFADMVGFTMLSQHLADRELAAVVARFEELAYDTVVSLGGRVVKMIGDEAMFVASTALDAARIGRRLVEAYAHDDLLSDVRVALAFGPVLPRDGDFYGPVVNLASRLVGIAHPGTVLMSDEFHTAIGLEPDGEFTGQALRPRSLKGIGWVQVWKLTQVGTEPGADHRRNMRWERLGDVLREIEGLRERGEKVMGERRHGGGADPSGPSSCGAQAGGSPDRSDSVEAEGGDPLGSELEVPIERE
ncbi:MAG: adenylate/guanylate cyclase domain-containing protein [Acidimicrobiales bacterium]